MACCRSHEWALFEVQPSWRLFLCVDASPAIANEILTFQRAIKGRLGGEPSGIRWISPEHSHLTIAYLEGCTPGILAPILHVVQERARSLGTFDISFGGPTLERGDEPGGSIWLSLLDGSDKIAALTDVVLDGFGPSSISVVTPSRPHLPIAFLDDDTHAETIQTLMAERADMRTPPMSVLQIHLCTAPEEGDEVFPVYYKLLMGIDNER